MSCFKEGLRNRHIFKLVWHAGTVKHPMTQNIFNSGFYAMEAMIWFIFGKMEALRV